VAQFEIEPLPDFPGGTKPYLKNLSLHKHEFMLALKGIYDGKNIKLLEKAETRKKYKVVVTFLEEIDGDSELRDFSSNTKSLDFWNDEREDIYQDYLSKKK
jgi:hypothetical protein